MCFSSQATLLQIVTHNDCSLGAFALLPIFVRATWRNTAFLLTVFSFKRSFSTRHFTMQGMHSQHIRCHIPLHWRCIRVWKLHHRYYTNNSAQNARLSCTWYIISTVYQFSTGGFVNSQKYPHCSLNFKPNSVQQRHISDNWPIEFEKEFLWNPLVLFLFNLWLYIFVTFTSLFLNIYYFLHLINHWNN